MSEKVYTIVFMAIIAAVFTAGVSGVDLLSRKRVRLNQKLARQRVVMRVLGIRTPPDASLEKLAEVYDRQVKDTGMAYEQEGRKFPILAGYDTDGKLLGYAFEISGEGFWDIISGYLAVSPDHRTILGIAFYRQSETPGLGAEITKPWFEEQFKDKPIPPDMAAGKGAIHLAVPGGEKGEYDVDAITGATQTSRHLQVFLNDDLRAALKALEEGK